MMSLLWHYQYSDVSCTYEMIYYRSVYIAWYAVVLCKIGRNAIHIARNDLVYDIAMYDIFVLDSY